ncbi:alpha/beta hydrolase family protein [Pseudomonas stutzeri]|uniref:alpha/beta hydrolase family protein n=1 Tax=Stutzerimonas stutzeri TaxID=316 RepID=UPI00210B9ED4|nr:alpha/beta hydrolase family protein [Stutzerimonas stutzeri]MCQ4312578.1 alpha/beta hydrolase family protein [Stutzerimonas stutzeri]
MPRFLEPLRLLVFVSAIVLASGSSAADEPVTPETTPATTPIERPKLLSRSEAMAADLKRQLPASEIVSLSAGEDEFLALWRPANVGAPKGLVILLPGNGESADWPRGIGPLRRSLPDHGWHTLSLSLPDAPQITPADTTHPDEPLKEEPEQPETVPEVAEEENAPNEAGYLPEETATTPSEPPLDEPEAQDSPEPEVTELSHADQIAERLDAALTFARSKQPRKIVLLGQGTGGYWAARYLQQLAPDDVAHLLLIQPHQPEGQDEALADLVTALKLATGDFYYKDNTGNLSAARERLNASRRIKHPAYEQVGLQPLFGNRKAEQEQLVRRVRGWLDRKR